MSKILYIKANAKAEGLSRTYKISDYFIGEYRKLHPEDEIITLDLYREGIDFLRQSELESLRKPIEGEGKDQPVLKYAFQFFEADKYVIAEPLWNLGIPAILKAYIDYIMVTGITFKYTASGPVGLCTGRKAVNITARGGSYSAGPAASLEMGDRYLRTVFGFMGITDFQTIAAEALDVVGNDADAVVGEAVGQAGELVKDF